MSTLCNFAVAPDRKLRRVCPGCKRRQTARFRECYDGYYLFFPCGTFIDQEREFTRGKECKRRR
jgi:hypothetical protein